MAIVSKIATMIAITAFHVPLVLAQHPPRFPSKIQSVTAKLYLSDSGKFSDNILDKPDFDLWNTISGEGSAGGPSDATLIEVEVDGDGGPNVMHNERLKVTLQIAGKPPIIRRNNSMLFSKNGKHFEALWLYDSGCLPVTISAQIGDQPPVRKKIDFQCGE